MGPVRAYAPASIGNFAAGFDILGAALKPLDGSLLGDLVSVENAGETILVLRGPYAEVLAQDARPNLVLRAWKIFRDVVNAKGGDCGAFIITLDKRLPVSSGLGSSASSIVATLVALQAACGNPLTREELLVLAGRAEGFYSGATILDNVAASLFGGFQLVLPSEENRAESQKLPWPEDLLLVVSHPSHALSTATSRAVLPSTVPVGTSVVFARNLALFIHALHTGNRALLGRCLRDPLAESHRAELVPGFRKAKLGAMAEGALGCSLSGAGPSVFAVAKDLAQAESIQEAIQEAFAGEGLGSEAWICTLDPMGARILESGHS